MATRGAQVHAAKKKGNGKTGHVTPLHISSCARGALGHRDLPISHISHTPIIDLSHPREGDMSSLDRLSSVKAWWIRPRRNGLVVDQLPSGIVLKPTVKCQRSAERSVPRDNH